MDCLNKNNVGCKLPSDDNSLKVLVCQLKREVEKLLKETEATLLAQNGKIGECCTYLKDNLSNSIRCLLSDMEASGELDEIITETILNEITVINKKFENEIDPDNMFGLTDSSKLQAAIDKALELIEEGQKCTIKLNHIFDITGENITINKPVNREKLIITGDNGGLIKNDSGYMFVKGETSYVTDMEIKDTTIKGVSGTKLFKSPDFINVTINNCKIENFDCLVDSDSYMQNIKLINSLVTGGEGNLFNGCGFYGLFINHNTIEHRSGYVIYQNIVGGNMYDSCYFIDMTDNLIEGFYKGGIAHFKKVHKVNISNNYFENMKENIVLNTSNNLGILSVDNNRLYVGSGDMDLYGVKGLINLLTNKYPEIHAHSNRIENCYLLTINNGFSVSKKINLASNCVANSNVNTDFSENGDNKNHEINVFPLIEVSNNINKYERTIPVISDKYYTKKLTINENDVRLSLINGEINSSVSISQVFGVGITNVNLYFGVPVYSDDITDIQLFSQNVGIRSKYRFGSGDDKYLLAVGVNETNSTQNATIIASFKTGACVRG